VLHITPGERDALRLIDEGRGRCEVAASLDVPECELDSRLAGLFNRMGVKSEREAAAECLKRGLCERSAAQSLCDVEFEAVSRIHTGMAPSYDGATHKPFHLERRLSGCDWTAVPAEIEERGCAIVGGLLSDDECFAIARLYANDGLFRSRVIRASNGFGRGEYKYFANPVPPCIGDLRAALYERLVDIANRWNEALEVATRFPGTHREFIDRCHRAGQTNPTPLLLQHGVGDFNALHQDLYGDHVFPLHVAILLSAPAMDFTGGEFVLVEQRPRMQSRVEVVPLRRGDGVVLAVNHRPVHGKRGVYRVMLRPGVSRVRSGRRHTLGIIFHDAR